MSFLLRSILSCLFLFAFLENPCAQVGIVDVYDVHLKVDFKNTEIQKALVRLSNVSKVNIAFDPNIFSKDKRISISKSSNLLEILEELLLDTGIRYYIRSGQIILLSPDSFANKRINVFGYVQDGETGERLPYAFVSTPDGKYFSTTNEYGFYSLHIPNSYENIVVSHVGFSNFIYTLKYIAKARKNVALQSNTEISDVIIQDVSKEFSANYDLFVNNSIDDMTKTQTYGGTADVLRHFNTLPGIKTGPDGTGGTSIRGGNIDNNLILLDGIPLYNEAHALRTISVFDEFILKSTKLYRSHIPAQYGGRLSGVMDIRMKEGNLHKTKGILKLGVLTGILFMEGPIIEDRLGYAFSYRKTFFNPFLSNISAHYKEQNSLQGTDKYGFSDFNGKLQFKIDERNRIYFSFYESSDRLYDRNKVFNAQSSDQSQVINDFNYNWYWKSRFYNFRWTTHLSHNYFSDFSIYFNKYDYSAFNYSSASVYQTNDLKYFLAYGSQYSTGIRDFGIKWNSDYYHNDIFTSRYGAEILNHQFSPGLILAEHSDSKLRIEDFAESLDDSKTKKQIGTEFNVYFEERINYGNLTSNLGIRMAGMQTISKVYLDFQPRLSLKYKLWERLYLKTSFNRNNQHLHQLSSSGLGFPTSLWILSTDNIKPQQNWQYTLGMDYNTKRGIVFSLEAYYKSMDNLVRLTEGASNNLLKDSSWEKNIPVGTGLAYGLEAALHGQYDIHSFNINYTLARTTRTFDQINSGIPFQAEMDRRFQLNTTYFVQLWKNLALNFTFVVAQGNLQTLPTHVNENEIIYTKINNHRLPLYHRLDFSGRYNGTFKKDVEYIVTFGFYNMYNRRNPILYYITYNPLDKASLKLNNVSIFSMLPNFSYVLKF